MEKELTTNMENFRLYDLDKILITYVSNGSRNKSVSIPLDPMNNDKDLPPILQDKSASEVLDIMLEHGNSLEYDGKILQINGKHITFKCYQEHRYWNLSLKEYVQFGKPEAIEVTYKVTQAISPCQPE